MRRYVLPILVAFWMVGGSVARADDGISEREKALAKKSYQHALELYKVGDYKAAAAELRKAYDYAPLPPILFNLGVTYMKLGNKSAAKAALSEYVAAMPKAPNRPEADKLLAEINSGGDEEAAPAPLSSEEARPVAPAAQPAKATAVAPLGEDNENPLEQQGARVEPTRVQERTRTERTPDTGETRHLGVWKWSAAGGAAACLVVGMLMLNQASQQEDALHAAAAPASGYPTQRYDQSVRDLEDGYTLNKTWGTVSLIGGAALAATSVTLFVMDGKPSSSTRAHVTPVVGNGVAAISLGGSF